MITANCTTCEHRKICALRESGASSCNFYKSENDNNTNTVLSYVFNYINSLPKYGMNDDLICLADIKMTELLDNISDSANFYNGGFTTYDW